MDKDFSYKSLLGFLEYVADHGLWKANTALGYRTAAAKVEGDLTEEEAKDVRRIDLDVVFQRFLNRNKVKVSPNTLATYKRRLEGAIDEFRRYREDPIGYRPRIGGARGGVGESQKAPQRSKPKAREAAGKASPPPDEATVPSTPMLTIPFPLRPDFLASVQIPRDLRKAEADRLAAFIQTLAMD